MTTRNRAAVKQRLVALATFAHTGAVDGRGRPLKVTYAWPGDDSTDSLHYFGEITGTSEPTAMGSGKRRSKDEFTVGGLIQEFGYKTAEAAEAAAEARLVEFEEYLTGGPKNLRHPDVPFDPDPPFDGVESAYIDDVQGPSHGQDPQGLFVGFVLYSVACTTRIY